MPVYSLFARTFENGNIIPSDEEWLIPKLNRLYEYELNENRIVEYCNHDIKCEYALISSTDIPEKDVKEAIGWGICFPKVTGEVTSRIILFKDLVLSKFLDIQVGHEYAHLGQGNDTIEDVDAYQAFSLELKIAELIGKKEEWIEYNKKEYPSRIKDMVRFSLIKK